MPVDKIVNTLCDTRRTRKHSRYVLHDELLSSMTTNASLSMYKERACNTH